jgi:hypothetical protein
MRQKKSDSKLAGFSKDVPRPLVYGALADFNRHFEDVLLDLERLAALCLLPKRPQPPFLKACRITLEETRAWVNFELIEIQLAREEKDWVRLGRLRQTIEKNM